MNKLGSRLLEAWYQDEPAPLWARALEPVYTGMVRLRRLAYRRGWRASGHPGRPVIVVGNLTVGGAGKTPLVIWLARALAARGLEPAIISRGYGGAEPARPHKVARDDDPAFCGDEPLLMAHAAGCAVWICRDRLAAASAAVAGGAGIVVADDGLQHYRLQRDFEILVIDSARGFGNGRCLPAGPMREPATRMAEVGCIVCNGSGRHCPPGGLLMQLHGEEAITLDGRRRCALTDFRGQPVHAIAGIGHPERFFRFLEDRGLEVVPHPLPDHGTIPTELLAPPDGRPVLMTSKDAMRCRGTPAAADAWHVPVNARLAEEGEPLLRRLALELGIGEA